MKEQIKEIICPNCGERNNHLLTDCRHCGVNLLALNQMNLRILQLESAGKTFLEEDAYVDSLRTYSILLEYKPNQPRYLKHFCLACIGLNALDKAEEIINDLEKRLKNDTEIKSLKKLYQQKLAQ